VHHVIDAASLLTIQEVVVPESYTDTLNDLTDVVACGDLAFPREVVHDLARRAKDEPLYMWAKAVSSSRSQVSVPFRHTQWVMGVCSDLCDQDAAVDSPTAVAALARSLEQDGVEFHLVTDDLLRKPLRIPLAEACDRAGWTRETVSNYLAGLGMCHRLR
jgi:hypothetical protein